MVWCISAVSCGEDPRPATVRSTAWRTRRVRICTSSASAWAAATSATVVSRRRMRGIAARSMPRSRQRADEAEAVQCGTVVEPVSGGRAVGRRGWRRRPCPPSWGLPPGETQPPLARPGPRRGARACETSALSDGGHAGGARCPMSCLPVGLRVLLRVGCFPGGELADVVSGVALTVRSGVPPSAGFGAAGGVKTAGDRPGGCWARGPRGRPCGHGARSSPRGRTGPAAGGRLRADGITPGGAGRQKASKLR